MSTKFWHPRPWSQKNRTISHCSWMLISERPETYDFKKSQLCKKKGLQAIYSEGIFFIKPAVAESLNEIISEF